MIRIGLEEGYLLIHMNPRKGIFQIAMHFIRRRNVTKEFQERKKSARSGGDDDDELMSLCFISFHFFLLFRL